MPNWCENTLKIYGKEEDIIKFINDNLGTPALYKEEIENNGKTTPIFFNYFSFNTLVPVPQCILDRSYYDAELSTNQLKMLVTNYKGVNDNDLDGYNWQIKNWGTKWDIYCNHLGMKDFVKHDDYYELLFYTAWNQPYAWFYQVGLMYPNLNMSLDFYEPGMNIGGCLYWTNGNYYEEEYSEEEIKQIIEKNEND